MKRVNFDRLISAYDARTKTDRTCRVYTQCDFALTHWHCMYKYIYVLYIYIIKYTLLAITTTKTTTFSESENFIHVAALNGKIFMISGNFLPALEGY